MRTWLEIDLKEYRKNLENIEKTLQEGEKIMLVVKDNSYGLGNEGLIGIAYKMGINNFAVATVREGVNLRERGFNNCQILVMGYAELDELDIGLKNDLILTVTCKEHAENLLKNYNKNLKISIAIDTGMSRIGFTYRELENDCQIINQLAQKFQIKGFFTHLSHSYSLSSDAVKFTDEQIGRFFNLKQKIKITENWHYKNSAGAMMDFPQKSTFVRVGITQYGVMPSDDLQDENLKLIFNWKAKIGCVKEVKKGDYIGYGRTYKAEKDMKIATVNVGYGDGYNRCLSNKGRVIIGDEYCNIVGTVCMDQFMVDVSKIKEVKVDDEVILIGSTQNCLISPDEIAEICNTISYEIISNISPLRVERIYKN